MIYGHSSGFTKTSFYDIFANFSIRNTFNTRSRAEHARKRRMMSHLFASQSVRAVEPISQIHVAELVRQWDYLTSHVEEIRKGSPLRGQLGSVPWIVDDGRVWVDCMPCAYLWFSD